MTYWVHIYEDDAHYGPFSFHQAKDYARVGSQFGWFDREVTRGKFGPVVRRYFGGEREFPVRRSQTDGLLSREIPTELK